MSDSKFVIKGLAEFQKELGRVNAAFLLKAPTKKAMNHLWRRLQVYPARAEKKKMKFKSAKQKRYFFWALSQGLIRVPYMRTRLLGRSWFGKVFVRRATVVGQLENPVPYGIFVMGRDDGTKYQQAEIHKGIWSTTDEIAGREQAQVQKFYDQRIEEVLRVLGD